MTYAHVPPQLHHVAIAKYILHQTVILAHTESAVVISHDACCILPAMLKHR
jgi:hypothetical protein